MICFLLPRGGQKGVGEYLEHWGRGVSDSSQIILYEDLPDLRRVDAGAYVLTALNQVSPAMRDLLVPLHDALSDIGLPVLNHPTRTLRRYDLLRRLHGCGLNQFRAARPDGDLDELRYPVFLREERSHSGPISDLLETPGDARRALARAVLRGYRKDALLFVEYLDTAGPDGLYRKYAAFIVGERIVPRSLACGSDWMLKHRKSDFTSATVKEEREYVFSNPHRRQLQTILRIAEVGYGRIDYSLIDGRIQTWEINLNPTIGRGLRPSRSRIPDQLQTIRSQSKQRFYGEFESAWNALASAGRGLEPLTAPYSGPLRRAVRRNTLAIDRAFPARSRWRVARRLVRPVKPALRLVAVPALAWWHRWVRG